SQSQTIENDWAEGCFHRTRLVHSRDREVEREHARHSRCHRYGMCFKPLPGSLRYRGPQISSLKIAKAVAHFVASRRRELLRIRKFKCYLRTAIVQHHASGLIAKLPPEVSKRQGRGRQKLDLPYQLLNHSPPRRLVLFCQGI